MLLLRFDASRRRRRAIPPTLDNRVILARLIEDLQIVALLQPLTLHRIARIVRAVMLRLKLRPTPQQLQR